jgi:hypothetical protein
MAKKKTKMGKWQFSEEELDRQFIDASVRGSNEQQPYAKSVVYDQPHERLQIELADGKLFGIPIYQIQGLASASPAHIAKFELSPTGDALHWQSLDLDLGIEGLINRVTGTRSWMAHLGRRGGQVSSEAKVAAARQNGHKGGRPRRKPSLS